MVPRMIGKDRMTAMKYTFHSFHNNNIVNLWQRCFMEVVIVPEGVEEISCAFEGCTHLRRLVLPASLKHMSSMEMEYILETYIDGAYKDMTIYAPAGSYAEAWAKENGWPFEALAET